jgi:hypothetical protein
MEPAEKYREEAKRARLRAHEAASDGDRAAWTNVADCWDQLARGEEALRGNSKPTGQPQSPPESPAEA